MANELTNPGDNVKYQHELEVILTKYRFLVQIQVGAQ